MSIGKTSATNGFDLRDFIVKYGFILVTVILFVWFASTEPTFRMQNTLFSMLKFTSVVAITGLGVTLTMVVGGLDLSVGSIAGLSVTLSAMTMVIYAQTGAIALVVVLLGGVLVGLFNAFLIVVLKIPDLLATLATMFTIMGLKLVPVDGQSVSSGLILRDGSVARENSLQDFYLLIAPTLVQFLYQLPYFSYWHL